MSKCENLQILNNCVISSTLYYICFTSCYVKMTYYSSKVNKPVVFTNAVPLPQQYRSLAVYGQWIHGQIIDAYTLTYIGKMTLFIFQLV